MKVKRSEKTVLSTTVAGLYSFMKCVGSCQFRRGLWMDISGEVTIIHMRTDAKNLVTTARTSHLLEQKGTIHMVSMLRNEACSVSIHDLAHIPTQNFLADCLTRVSAKADNLVTAVKTGRLLEVDIRPDFRTPLIEHKALLCTWCRTFMHTREKELFFLNALKISLAPTLQEGPFQVMFLRNQHVDEQKELNTCELESQDAARINVCTRRFTHPIFLVDDVDFGENVLSVLGSYDTFCLVSLAPPSSSFL